VTNALPRRLEPSVRFDPLRKTGRPLRVALVRPPVYASRYNTSETPVPPLGLAYLASAVRNAGHDVRVIDALGEDLDGPRPAETGWWRYGIPLEEIEERLRYSPDVIGVSCMFSNDWPRVRETVRRLKKRLPSSLFVGGGEHCTALPETCLASCPELDAIVLGEGEQGFLEFLEEAAGGKRFDSVPGLAVRDGARVARTPARGRIANIDDLPPPAWDLLPLENGASAPGAAARSRCLQRAAARINAPFVPVPACGRCGGFHGPPGASSTNSKPGGTATTCTTSSSSISPPS
jgi:anaerobic magnesium-protoporphyrin IX monomethyl ester cyclase